MLKGKTIKKRSFSVGKGKYKINLDAIITERGLIVSILGGENPHVGAVALGISRPSLMDPSKYSATTSVLTVVGHKDDEVAKPAAEKITRELKQNVVVISGMHIEGANYDDVKKLSHNSIEAVEIFLEKIKK